MPTSVVPPPGEQAARPAGAQREAEPLAATAPSAEHGGPAPTPPTAPAKHQTPPSGDGARRTLALWIPDWPVVAAAQAGLIKMDEPVALMHAGRVAALSASARQAGVRTGMRQRSAQEACPELTLLPRQEGYEVISFEPVAAAAQQVIAAIEVIRPGLVVAPARGASRYHGGDARLAGAVLGQVIDKTGHECEVGIADGLLAAVLAAQSGVIVPPGATPAFLAGHPLRALARALGGRDGEAKGLEDLVDTWNRLGIATLGDLAGLPHGQVLARFGPLGDWAWRLARGRDVRVGMTHRDITEVSADLVLDPPVDNVERAAFAARGCAEQLYDLLASRGLGFTRLEVVARTEDGHDLRRTWRVESLDVAAVVDRVRWQLEGWLGGRSGERPTSGLTWLSLIAHDAAPGGAYHASLWGRNGREVQAQRTAERIDTLLKNDGLPGLYLAVEQGGRDPRSRVRLVSWGDEATELRPKQAPWPGRLPDPAPATIYARPPRIDIVDATGAAVRVDIRLTLSGNPATCMWPATQGSGQPGMAGSWPIASWAGPWPVVERWWAGKERLVFLQVLLGSPHGQVAPGVQLRAPSEADAQLHEGTLILVAYSGGTWRLEGRYD